MPGGASGGMGTEAPPQGGDSDTTEKHRHSPRPVTKMDIAIMSTLLHLVVTILVVETNHGVIAVVIFVTVSALAIMARFLYRRKWTCQSQEVKRVKPEDNPEVPFNSRTTSQNGPTENQKEYFI